MNQINDNFVYVLIDKDQLISQKMVSNDKLNVIHEYLALIDEKLKILRKLGIHINSDKLTFNNLSILVIHHIKSQNNHQIFPTNNLFMFYNHQSPQRYPMIETSLYLNFQDFKLYDDNGPFFDVSSCGWGKRLITSIKNNYRSIQNKKSIIINNQKNKQENTVNTILSNTENILNQKQRYSMGKNKRAIPTINTNKNSSDNLHKVASTVKKYSKGILNANILGKNNKSHDINVDQCIVDIPDDVNLSYDLYSDDYYSESCSSCLLCDSPPCSLCTPSTTSSSSELITSLTEQQKLEKSDDIHLENVDTVLLEDYMYKLKNLKDIEKKKLENLQYIHDDDINNFTTNNNELNDEKRFLRTDMERSEEKLRIFESDKSVYRKIKTNIEKNNLAEEKIPELFATKYPIFKFLDEQKMLNTDEVYEIYCELYDDLYPQVKHNLANTYVPHNFNYLSNSEQEKYKDAIKYKDSIKYKDDIEEFIKKKNETQYKPLDEMLADISDSDNCDSDNCDSIEEEVDGQTTTIHANINDELSKLDELNELNELDEKLVEKVNFDITDDDSIDPDKYETEKNIDEKLNKLVSVMNSS
jgi:hypothetical protein